MIFEYCYSNDILWNTKLFQSGFVCYPNIIFIQLFLLSTMEMNAISLNHHLTKVKAFHCTGHFKSIVIVLTFNYTQITEKQIQLKMLLEYRLIVCSLLNEPKEFTWVKLFILWIMNHLSSCQYSDTVQKLVFS